MVIRTAAAQNISERDATLSLYHLLEPEVRGNPYPLYHRLRSEDPVHWDPFLHKWVVTRYADAVTVFQHFSAHCAASPAQLKALGLSALTPIARVLVRQMLFTDPPAHGRVRGLAAKGFTPRRVDLLRAHIQDIVDSLLDAAQARGGHMDVIADLAYPLPAMVNAEMLGVPAADWKQLTAWSDDFAQVLGNLQYSPERTAELDGDRLSEEEIVANLILVMVGGQETTTNLIGNGVLTLLRHPEQLELLRTDLSLTASAVEELLRYESPSQQTTRLAPEDMQLGGKTIRCGQTVMVVMGAANRDPERFPDPDRLDICRQDNRHLAFGWANHFCFGAPLARLEGQIVFQSLLRRMPDLTLEPGPLVWRDNLGLRGLLSLQVTC